MSSIALNIRFSPEQVAALDSARGNEGRGTFLKRALEAYLRQRKIANMCEWAAKTAAEDNQIAESLLDSLDGPIPE